MSLTAYYTEQADQDNLLSYFDKSATLVRQTFLHYESKYARPIMRSVVQSFYDRPILSTLLAIFAILSLLPTLSFIGFALFILASCFIICLGCFLVAISVIAFFGMFFVASLLATLGVSVFLTAFGVGGYSVLQMALLVRADGPRAGINGWMQQNKQHLFASMPAKSEFDAQDYPETEKNGDVLHGITTESIVADNSKAMGGTVSEVVDNDSGEHSLKEEESN
ncbi:uncharacterized protein LAESUDRAFT_752727 [Laetiporus sulphureus 93-53]|uniref:Uncharacterized protein n=1 Tax=Laetiporus sulphureus 93-53 TaxID=1314785 RepID=A0A165BN93_9APHY|nr:uncharacterized protein LAESUDRAFT_752727 [Laetiporus sulphureus 93-53]KZT01350.1 hypothetical protein LAESUDRAFT_752727 [Laetiporus sulphureus 93-53]